MATTKVKPEPIPYKQGLEECRKFASKSPQRHAAVLLMEEDGKYFLWIRDNEPCYGFLRTYGPKSTRPQDYKPSDLYNDFPPGTPVILAVPFRYVLRYTEGKEFFDYFFSQESPWKDVFKDSELMCNEEFIYGIVFKDTDIDSTLLISMLRQSRDLNNLLREFFEFRSKGLSIRLAFLACFYMVSSGHPKNFLNPPKAFINGEYIKDITGGTFRNRYAYNRPEVDFVFGRPKINESFPKIMYETSYGNYSLEHSISVLKEMAGE